MGFSEEEAVRRGERRFENILKGEARHIPFADALVHGFVKNFNINLDSIDHANPHMKPFSERINLTLTERQAERSDLLHGAGDSIENAGKILLKN